MSWISKSKKCENCETETSHFEEVINERIETQFNTQEPKDEEESQLMWRGIAKICFLIYSGSSLLEMDHFLHGQFLLLSEKKVFGIMATQRDKDKKGDCCQYDSTDPPLWFDFTLIDYNNKKEWNHVVEKRGGDFVRLHSEFLDFHTETLKVDKEAKTYIQTFFPKISSFNFSDALVCIGPLSIKLEQIPKDAWIDCSATI